MTQEQRYLVWRYWGYQFFSSLFFIGAVWLYFYRLFISDAEVGILDGMAFFIGLVAEVPSGVLADKFGRGRIARVGLLLSAAGFLGQALGSSFLPFFVGQSVANIGASFISGADDALFFSKLNFDRDSLAWRKVVTRGAQVALLGSLFATLIGGWLHTVDARLPWVLTGLAFLGASWLLWHVNEDKRVNDSLSVEKEVESHFKIIWDGFAFFRSSELFRYVPFILTVQGLFYATGWGLLRIVLLDRFHFDPLAGSFVVAGCNVLTVVSLSVLHHQSEKISERWMFCFIALSSAVSLLASLFDLGVLGIGVIFALYAGERILYPILSETLNKHAPERQRATILSIASFFKVLPYVLLAPVIGALNGRGALWIFLIVWPVLIVAALWFYWGRKDETVKG